MKYNHDAWLRFGFGIFLSIWGIDRIMRATTWASDALMGQFYGTLGTMANFVIVLGVIQLLIASSFFLNYQVKCTSLFLVGMIFASTLVTLKHRP